MAENISTNQPQPVANNNLNLPPSGQPQPYPNAGFYLPQPYNPSVDSKHKEQMKLREIEQIIPAKRGGSWSGLAIRPDKVSFKNQNPDEKVFVVVRRHWSVNIGWIVRNILYSLIPPLVFYILAFFNFDFQFLTPTTTIVLLLMFYSVIFTNVVRDFFDWYFDPYIVTNQRIKLILFSPFTSYTVKEAELNNIEFVREKAAGILAGLFNYGNVEIATASERAIFNFEKVPEATLIRDIITDLRRIDKKYNG